MDDKYTNTNKSKEDEKKVDKLLEESRQKSSSVDTSMFDETLEEINQILTSLEQKSEVDKNELENQNLLPEIKSAISKINVAKNELTKVESNFIKNNNLLERIELLEKNISNSNKTKLIFDNLEEETDGEIKEHKINKHLLPIEELYAFEESDKRKKKNSFGFYSFLVLTIVILLTLYGILSISKDLIILKYPITESYINYFYEIIEIIKITIFSLYGFFKNII